MTGRREGFVPMEVAGVRRHLPADDLVVLLVDRGSRLMVPILIGPAEATAIAVAVEGVTPPRPLTHDLLCSVLGATGHAVEHVEITQLLDGVFHAALVLDSGARLDSRASDAIAVAVRVGRPVLCSADVIAAAGVEAGTPDAEQEVERFREFLDSIDPDDFAGTGGDEGPRR